MSPHLGRARNGILQWRRNGAVQDMHGEKLYAIISITADMLLGGGTTKHIFLRQPGRHAAQLSCKDAITSARIAVTRAQ